MQQHLTRIEQANLIAGHAVAYATAYLDGRHTAHQLADNANRLIVDLLVIQDAENSAFLVPVQLLAFTMLRTSRRKIPETLETDALAERWHAVMASLVELVQHESRNLNKDRA